MKPNNEAMRISDRPGEDLKVYEVLREWGYSESVIQRLLAEETAFGPQFAKGRTTYQEITPALIES